MEYHLQERQIDLLLLAPERLEPGQRQEYESHLSSCSSCRALCAFLRDVYEELKSRSTGTDNRVDAFVDRLLRQEQIIELHPYRYVPASGEFGENALTVLAAQSRQESNLQYSAVCTLISRDERAIVRVLQDSERQRYRIFLVANDRPASARATVVFPGLGLGITMPAGSSQADFPLPSGSGSIDWGTLTGELRFSQD